MDIRTLVFGSLLLLVIVSLLALALLMIRLQRRADQECVSLDERIAGMSPPPACEAAVEQPEPTNTDAEHLGAPSASVKAVEVFATDVPPLNAEVDANDRDRSAETTEGDYAMRAPVELWLGDSVVGVRSGSGTYDSFRKYADALLCDLKAAQEATR